MLKEKEFQLLHVTGDDHHAGFLRELKSKGIEISNSTDIKVEKYMNNMPDALAAADLVVTSAGAITLAEITAVGIPSILIPKSHATDNHQEYNARALEKNGAAVVLLESELTGEILYNNLVSLIRNKTMLNKMETASRQMGITDAADRIFCLIKDTINN